MGGQPSKENNLDKLQDSRDAMKSRDENHLAKEGKDKNIGFVPRRETAITQNNATKATTKPVTNVKKKPSIQCSES